MVKWRTHQISSRQIRRGRAHKDRGFVLFTNHGGRQESSDLFALIRISTFYSLRGFFEHLDIEPTASAHRPTVHFVCNNGCNLFHTVSAMIFCPAAVGWI